jgi:hypothetical protein
MTRTVLYSALLTICLCASGANAGTTANLNPPQAPDPAPNDMDHTPRAVAQSGNGFLYISGNSYSRMKGMGYWIWKIADNGEKIWEKSFKSQYQDEIRSIIATPDGGVLVLGQMFVYEPETGHQIWVMQIDKNGKTVFEKKMDGIGWSDVLLRTADGDYLLAGTSRRRGKKKREDYDFRIVKFDPRGAEFWEAFYNKGADEAAFSGIAIEGGSFIFAGTSGKYNRFGEGEYLGWLAKIDDEGTLLGETGLPDCESMSSGEYLARNDYEFAVAYSLTRHVSFKPIRPLRAHPARIMGFDYELKPRWRMDRGGYASDAAPMIVTTHDRNYLTAGGVQNGVRIDKVASGGRIIWEKRIALEQGGRMRFDVEGMVTDKNIAFVMGGMSNTEDSEAANRVFLLKIDAGLGDILLKKIY